jgi:hypothetical protein
MDQMKEKQLPEKFSNAFADIPPLPGQLFAVITRKIARRTLLTRSVWAVAASLLITVSSLTAYRMTMLHGSSSPDAAEVLNTVSSYYNSSVYQEDEKSYVGYEEVLYQE